MWPVALHAAADYALLPLDEPGRVDDISEDLLRRTSDVDVGDDRCQALLPCSIIHPWVWEAVVFARDPMHVDSAGLERAFGELDAAGEYFQSEDESADHADLPEQGDGV